MIVEVIAAGALAYVVKDHLTTPFDPLFEQEGAAANVPPNLLRAIARVESNFNAAAVSPLNSNGTRDYGLCQINAATAKRYGYADPNALLDPVKNVRLASRILADTRASLRGVGKFTSIGWAMAYNVGPDLQPYDAGAAYGQKVIWHWTLYDLGRALA